MFANKKKILIVDDDRDIVELLEILLKSKGFGLLTAFDGNEALEKTRKGSPDLLVLDLMLPYRDGNEVCRIIKSDENLKHIKVLILSARVSDADKRIAAEAGADAYITKPFSPKDLVEKINMLFEPSQED